MTDLAKIIDDLPDTVAARRFLDDLDARHPTHFKKLISKKGLLSDVLTIATFSPLLATTLLQHPEYITWLDPRRRESGVTAKEELKESLSRFAMTHSDIDAPTLVSRFRRRELMRIFLHDIRRIETIVEVTEEISNLADVILEFALERTEHDIRRRYGNPQSADENGRLFHATFCIVALGKLGSRELNYSSDIDLLFLYSDDGRTSGGERGSVTNREYFSKLAEQISRSIGQMSNEGAAYRVDLRLRPHGSMGALALSVTDTVKYYRDEARAWERQVMIRSRAAAGDASLYRCFFDSIEDIVFDASETVPSALNSVRSSKEKIDKASVLKTETNVKLSSGGIREIEFISQALQLAHGGRDRWLRSPHTLISLQRLADRGHIRRHEHTELSEAYHFLRRTEHVLQMENGLQTHIVPNDADKRLAVADRVEFMSSIGDFETLLASHMANVHRAFTRILGSYETTAQDVTSTITSPPTNVTTESELTSEKESKFTPPHFSRLLSTLKYEPAPADVAAFLNETVLSEKGFGSRILRLRKEWNALTASIIRRDLDGEISTTESKNEQTALAEASIQTSICIAIDEGKQRLGIADEDPGLSAIALGKLGSGGLDHGSDLDLIFVHDRNDADGEASEMYSKFVELFVTAISSMTRDGSLYRVDLRLRPYGTKGLTANSSRVLLDYLRDVADIWELLALVKIRSIGEPGTVGSKTEDEARKIIHERAKIIEPQILANEVKRIRNALENKNVRTRRDAGVDIKYGKGGMLDVYFAARFLQLRDDLRDTDGHRSTSSTLRMLNESGSINDETYNALLNGYHFLSELDHAIRLIVGRSTRVPVTNTPVTDVIARKLGIDKVDDLFEKLHHTRLNIREAFDSILNIPDGFEKTS